MFKLKTFWLVLALLVAMLTNRGDANLVVDDAPYNLAYLYASVEGEEPPLVEGHVVSGGSFISAIIMPGEEVVPVIEEVKSEISVSASFEKPPYDPQCQCVDFIKNYYPALKNRQLNYPLWMWRNFEDYGMEKTELAEGVLVILKTEWYPGHVAVVSSVSDDEFWVIEKNNVPCIIGTRSFQVDDPNIVGYLK